MTHQHTVTADLLSCPFCGGEATAMVPGSSVVYHRGTSLKHCRYVKQVRQLYDMGRVDLVQKRVEGGFAYVAIFRRAAARRQPLHTFRDAGLA